MGRALVPCNGNDKVFTPDALAVAIANHFQPSGRILEPCYGGGAFVRAIPGCDWCELDKGRDFMDCNGRYDWVITNPPWSKLRAFLNKSMEVSDNVVFLCLINAFFMRARMADMDRAGFGFVEITSVPTPPKPWPQTGFQLGAVHIRKGHGGPVVMSKLQGGSY